MSDLVHAVTQYDRDSCTCRMMVVKNGTSYEAPVSRNCALLLIQKLTEFLRASEKMHG